MFARESMPLRNDTADFFLSGSQEAPRMQGATESLAGRAAIVQRMPLSIAESPKVAPLIGGFPEAVRLGRHADVWFRSSVQTYLERDTRAVTGVRDVTTFRRMHALVASRSGQMLNKTDSAAPLGVSVPTVTQWLSMREATGQLMVIPPYVESFAKRIAKTPKMYFADSRLACHLLGITSASELARSPFLGAVYEGFVAVEIAKAQINAGKRRELYGFRDKKRLEVDFIVPQPSKRIALVEVKASRTVGPSDARSLVRLASAAGASVAGAYGVHALTRTEAGARVAPGASAVSLAQLHERLR